jgi:hypothetical protein
MIAYKDNWLLQDKIIYFELYDICPIKIYDNSIVKEKNKMNIDCCGFSHYVCSSITAVEISCDNLKT